MGNTKIGGKSVSTLLANTVAEVSKIPHDELCSVAIMSSPNGQYPTLKLNQFFNKDMVFQEKKFHDAVLEVAENFIIYEIVSVMKIKKGARIDYAHVLGEQNYFMPKYFTMGGYQHGACKLIKDRKNTDLSFIMKVPQAFFFWGRDN